MNFLLAAPGRSMKQKNFMRIKNLVTIKDFFEFFIDLLGWSMA